MKEISPPAGQWTRTQPYAYENEIGQWITDDEHDGPRRFCAYHLHPDGRCEHRGDFSNLGCAIGALHAYRKELALGGVEVPERRKHRRRHHPQPDRFPRQSPRSASVPTDGVGTSNQSDWDQYAAMLAADVYPAGTEIDIPEDLKEPAPGSVPISSRSIRKRPAKSGKLF